MKNISAKIVAKGEKNILEGIFRLRHEVFAVEKGWVPKSNSRMERDDYDEYAGYIAVLKRNRTSGADQVIATARFITLENKMMLDEEFKELVEGIELVREGAIEITRVAIDRKYRNIGLDALVYRKLIRWSHKNNIHHWYFVIEEKYLDYLNHLKIKAVPLGKPKTFEDGVEAIAAYIDLKHVLEVLQVENDPLYKIVTARPLIQQNRI